jgi:hypothetical protein
MYGLRKINNHYRGGSRGDWIIVGHQEFKHGRSKPLPYMTACLGRPSKSAPTFVGRGPKPISSERLMRMTQGLREPRSGLSRSNSVTSDPGSRCSMPLDSMDVHRTEVRNRPQSAVPGRMQQNVLQEHALDSKATTRPTSAPACTRASASMNGRYSRRMPAQDCRNASLPRTAAQAQKALAELRASLGLEHNNGVSKDTEATIS